MNSPKNPTEEKLLPTLPSNQTSSSRISTKECTRKLSVPYQIKLLITKNLRIFQRTPSFFIYHTTLLFLVYMWMLFITYLVKHQSPMSRTTTFPPQPINSFRKCGDSSLDEKSNCLSLGIVIVDDDPDSLMFESQGIIGDENKGDAKGVKDWISRALYDMKMKFGLEGEKDLKIIYRGTNMEELYDEMGQFKQIKNMVSFCNGYDFFRNSTLSVECGGINYLNFELDLNVYGVHFNYTRLMPNYLRNLGTPILNDTNAIYLKQTIDESILNFYKEEPESQHFSIPYKPIKHCSRSEFIKTNQKPKMNKILTDVSENSTIISNS